MVILLDDFQTPSRNLPCPARLDPKMFGHPNNRLRAWRIIYHTKFRKWSCKWTLDQLAKMILCDRQHVSLNYSVYLRPLGPMQAVREMDLTEHLGVLTCDMFFV